MSSFSLFHRLLYSFLSLVYPLHVQFLLVWLSAFAWCPCRFVRVFVLHVFVHFFHVFAFHAFHRVFVRQDVCYFHLLLFSSVFMAQLR